MAITKTKHAYYTLEKRFGEIVKCKHRGYKITIGELTFYSEEEYIIHKVTLGINGTGINVEAKDLEEAEKILNENYDIIKEKQDKWIQEHPHFLLENVKEEE